jgi:hypothetical protein
MFLWFRASQRMVVDVIKFTFQVHFSSNMNMKIQRSEGESNHNLQIIR